MRLDLDCVRKILLCVENNTGLRESCFFIDSGLEKSEFLIGNAPVPPPDYQAQLLKEFDNDTLIYHVNYCIEAGLLSAIQPLGMYCTTVTDLTPPGHSFLENIRDNKIWNGVKGIASKVGVKSLESVIQIASSVLTQLIKAQFGM